MRMTRDVHDLAVLQSDSQRYSHAKQDKTAQDA